MAKSKLKKVDFKIKDNYSVLGNGYNFFKSKYPTSELSRNDYITIYNSFLDIYDNSLFSGNMVYFFSTAFLNINLIKRNFNKLGTRDIDWKESKKQGKLVYHLDEYRGRLYVSFHKNLKDYRIKFVWQNSRKLAKVIREKAVIFPLTTKYQQR
jgi:hypothetical protein